MLKNHRLAQAVSDASMREFHRQIEYKTQWAGGTVIKAGRFFPSSKTCSTCGTVKRDLTLNDRVYICNNCGFEIDRDLNAAINLKNLAGSSPVIACCQVSAGRSRKASVKLASGQEPNSACSLG
jgi:putative transposase